MPADVFDLTDQVAVITGGGTGIGRATALVLAERGADVVVASRRVENLEKTAGQVRERGRKALVVQTDVRDVDQCHQLVDRTLEELGRLDILVNNAGGSRARPLEDWDADAFDNAIALNLRSVFMLSVAAAKHMRERGHGAIVNISSGSSQTGLPFVAPYGAAKTGVNNLTKTLAAEYGPHGVRVNCIAVGAVKSEGFVREMEGIGQDPDAIGALATSMGRAGTPEEIAYPILFLVSEAASYLSGQTIYVGGSPSVPRMLP